MSEVNVRDVMQTIKARAAQRRASSEYQKITADIEKPNEKSEWRELDHNLHAANVYVESFVKVPITTGKRWPARSIAMKVHRVLRLEISAAVDPSLRRQQAWNERSVRVMNEIVKTLKSLVTNVDQLKLTQSTDTTSFASELKLLNERIRLDTPSLSEDEYTRFQERYRGSYEEIQNKQAQYIRFFVNQPDIVVDLGCGRGEFLELLVKHGVPSYGVDTSHEMVAGCETRGLRVINEDAVAHLRSVSDDSLGGIFCAQTIEHLRPADQIELLRLCYRKLKHGRFLLVETVNPRCLSVLSESFYLDMTHIRPVHPETLSFLLSEIGFSKVEFIYSSPFPPEARLDKINSSDENARAFNSNVEKLNNLLWGYQDYAVVATK